MANHLQCDNCGGEVDFFDPQVRDHQDQTGELFCEKCIEEGDEAERAYERQDHEEPSNGQA